MEKPIEYIIGLATLDLIFQIFGPPAGHIAAVKREGLIKGNCKPRASNLLVLTDREKQND